MSDSPIKKRMARAKQRAQEDLIALGYEIPPPECIVAYRGGEVRIIRICLDDIGMTELKTLKRRSSSPVISREVWVRESGATRFVITIL